MPGKTFRIFYTDDDSDDQELFREVVQAIHSSADLQMQNNGDELISTLESSAVLPHIIFLDLNMPIKNGLQTLQEIRASEKYKSIPVIIFTTSNDARAIENTFLLGANYYISKPFEYASLKNAIMHCLSIDWKIQKTTREDFVYKTN